MSILSSFISPSFRLLSFLTLSQPYNLPIIIPAYLLPLLYLIYLIKSLQVDSQPIVQVKEVVREIDSDKRKIRRLEVKNLHVRRDGQVSPVILSS